jgi:translation initiation factor 4G
VIKNAAERTVLAEHNTKLNAKMDKAHVNEQKQLIAKYKDALADYLVAKPSKQIDAIYAMQVYVGSKGFPKYLLAHLFNAMYDLELIEEEAFYAWKDEINENYPNKGQALFHVKLLSLIIFFVVCI